MQRPCVDAGRPIAGAVRCLGPRIVVALFAVFLPLAATSARGQTLLERALELRAAGRHEEAVAAFEALAGDTARDPATIALLADEYARSARRQEAIATARRALSLDPCRGLAHVVLARVGIPVGEGMCRTDPDSTWWHLRAAVACDSTDAEAWFLLAREAATRGDDSAEREARERTVRTGFWTPGMLAYGRWLLADVPERALLVAGWDEVASLCAALQAAEGLRPDVIVVSAQQMWDEPYRKRLESRWGLSFMRGFEWQLHADPGKPPPTVPANVRQIERWMKRSGRSSRPLAIPCTTPMWSRSMERRLVRRAACWVARSKSGARAPVDTASIRAGLVALDAGVLSGVLGRADALPTDGRFATRVRAQALASALLLEARARAADRPADAEWAARRAADLSPGVAEDSTARDWCRRVGAATEKLADRFPEWLVMGPAYRGGDVAVGSGYVYVEELPEAVKKVTPVYPAIAREAGVSGTVVVQALVGKDGRVKDLCLRESIALLDAAAVAAVREWVFKPARSDGKPVAVWVAVPVRFSFR